MSTKKFSALRSRAEEIAAQMKALEDEEKAYQRTIDEAVKHAGRTRAEFVEKLYEFFQITPETTLRRDKDGEVVRDKNGRPVEVKTDKNEAVRIQKLAEAFARLVDGPDSTDEASSPAEDAALDNTVDAPVPSAPTAEPPSPSRLAYGADAA